MGEPNSSAPPLRPSLLVRQHRIALDVHPIRGARGLMTRQTVLSIVRCYLLVRRVTLEQRPAPSVTPERIAGIPSLPVLDHDEPYFRRVGSPVRLARGHSTVRACKYLLDQDGSISELIVQPIGCRGACADPDQMHLAFRVAVDPGCPQRRECVAHTIRSPDISVFVNVLEPVRAESDLNSARRRRLPLRQKSGPSERKHRCSY